MSAGELERHDPALHLRDRHLPRPRARHPGPRREHRRAGHGLAARHPRHAGGPVDARRRHRQAPGRSGACALHSGATASGVVRCVRSVFAAKSMDLAGARAVVQGFGKVGGAARVPPGLGRHAGGGRRRRRRRRPQPRRDRRRRAVGPRGPHRVGGRVRRGPAHRRRRDLGASTPSWPCPPPSRAPSTCRGRRRLEGVGGGGGGQRSHHPRGRRGPRPPARSPSSPTSWPTPAASPPRTSNGPRAARATPGTRRSSPPGWPGPSTTPSTRSGTGRSRWASPCAVPPASWPSTGWPPPSRPGGSFP